MVKLRFRLGLYSYREAVSTQHGALEYGSNLHVNERQKMTLSHYIGLLKNKNKKECKWRFFASCGAHVNCAIMAMLYTHSLESAVEHDGDV